MARARRPPRGRPGRGDRALRARRGAVHAARCGDEHLRPAHPRPAAPPASSRTCSSAPASPRPTRRRSSRPTTPTRTRSRCPSRSRSSRRPADDSRPRPRRALRSTTSTRATRRSRCSSSPASTCRRAGSSPTSAGTSAGSWRAAISRAKGAVELLYDALGIEPAVEPTPASVPATPGKAARSEAGVVGELHPLLLDGELGRSSSWTCAELFAARRPSAAVRGRDHVPGAEAGPRVRRRRGRAGGRSRRGRARGGRARAARDARLRRLPRRAGRAGAQVDRVPRRVPVARADTDRRGRGPSCGSGSSPRSPSASAPRCVHETDRARSPYCVDDAPGRHSCRRGGPLASPGILLGRQPAADRDRRPRLHDHVSRVPTARPSPTSSRAPTSCSSTTSRTSTTSTSSARRDRASTRRPGPTSSSSATRPSRSCSRTAIKVDFVCDAHAAMHGTFTVGTVAAPPPAKAVRPRRDSERASGSAQAGGQGARGDRLVHGHVSPARS